MLPAVATDPAMAMLPAVATDPATAMLPAVAIDPATAMLPAVAIDPATAMVSVAGGVSTATAEGIRQFQPMADTQRAGFAKPHAHLLV